jgi:8-oxo-dGTP pyrophosphatase MutT (NUDIX family)
MKFMKPIRNSAKALIIKDGKLLATKNEDDWGVFYLLPGGGQEAGENLREALARECMEEISARVEIGDILLVREYIGKNHEFAEWDSETHQIEYMFDCVLLNEEELGNGNIPDNAQIGFEWLDLDELHKYRIYPAALKDYLGREGKKTGRVYMGAVN